MDHVHDFGDLFFGDHVDLEMDFFAEVVDLGLTVLGDEDENGEEDCFEGNDHGE